MPAAVPAILGVTAALSAAGTTASLVTANQERQRAKGAAQAQKTEIDNALAGQKLADQQNKTQKAEQASSTQQAAIAAIKANMTAAQALGGTVLTNPNNPGTAPTVSKTLLGI